MITPLQILLITFWLIGAITAGWVLMEDKKPISRYELLAAIFMSLSSGFIGLLVIGIASFFDRFEPKKSNNWWNQDAFPKKKDTR